MDADLMGCEACSKETPIETMRAMDDCWFCAGCAAEFDKAFAACQHKWEPQINSSGDAGQFCGRCGGFVCNEDIALLSLES